MPGDLDSLEETSKATSSTGCCTTAALQFEPFWDRPCNFSLEILKKKKKKSCESASHNTYTMSYKRVKNSMH